MRFLGCKVLLLAAALLTSAFAADSRRVAIYTGMSDNVLDYIKEAEQSAGNQSVINTVYFCCSAFTLSQDSNNFTIREGFSIDKYRSYAKPLLDAGMDVFWTIKISNAGVFNVSSPPMAALTSLAKMLKDELFGTGIIMDFEPGYEDYHRTYKMSPVEAANKYSSYLIGQAVAMKQYGIPSTFDSGNWGIINIPEFPQLAVNEPSFPLLTTMGTYHYTNTSQQYVLDLATTAQGKGYSKESLDFGIGTTLKPEWMAKYPNRKWLNFNWTASTFRGFATFLSDQGFERMSFWRNDIDEGSWPASASEPWMWNVASDFLNNKL